MLPSAYARTDSGGGLTLDPAMLHAQLRTCMQVRVPVFLHYSGSASYGGGVWRLLGSFFGLWGVGVGLLTLRLGPGPGRGAAFPPLGR